MNRFAVVKFLTDSTVAVLPSKWIISDIEKNGDHVIEVCT